MALNVDKAIEAYVKIRDARGRLKAAYDAEDQALKDKLEKIEVALMVACNESNTTQFASPNGTAYKQIQYKGSCSDWPSMWNFCAENSRFDMLEKRLSLKPIQEYIEENGIAPPGVNISSEYKIIVRRK